MPASMFLSTFPNFLPASAPKAFFEMFVLMYPGMTLQTPIPQGLSSLLRESMMPMKAAFEAAQLLLKAVDSLAAWLVMPMICPDLLFIMCGRTSCICLQGPCTFTFMRVMWFSKEASWKRHLIDWPAFSTKTSSFFPYFYILQSTFLVTFYIYAQFDMSSLTIQALSGILQLFSTLQSQVTFLAERITQAPQLLYSYAIYSPIPEDAPVIQTIFPLQSGRVNFLRMQATSAQRTNRVKIPPIKVQSICRIFLTILQEHQLRHKLFAIVNNIKGHFLNITPQKHEYIALIRQDQHSKRNKQKARIILNYFKVPQSVLSSTILVLPFTRLFLLLAKIKKSRGYIEQPSKS